MLTVITLLQCTCIILWFNTDNQSQIWPFTAYFTNKASLNRTALGIGADTGLWLMPAQYERIARTK
jgi:hypothetical protein